MFNETVLLIKITLLIKKEIKNMFGELLGGMGFYLFLNQWNLLGFWF